uniref:Sperm protamine P1 n=4 Tax=Phocoenidae TaxID=9740 RepID=A0A8C9E464_PHOSS|nr:protamine P1 [Phocoena phocoena]ACU51721.1 protamine P1 [Phocoenoides dalli]ACU51722.1 protamine P1 [Neophocaena phocaenoides]
MARNRCRSPSQSRGRCPRRRYRSKRRRCCQRRRRVCRRRYTRRCARQ